VRKELFCEEGMVFTFIVVQSEHTKKSMRKMTLSRRTGLCDSSLTDSKQFSQIGGQHSKCVWRSLA
jgi:hypothetical protein